MAQKDKIQIAIVCAVRIEVMHARNSFEEIWGTQLEQKSYQGIPYLYGSILVGNEARTVALFLMYEMGPEQIVEKIPLILSKWRPRFAAMIGICGGDRRQVAAGDLVVVRSAYADGPGSVRANKTVDPEPKVSAPPENLIASIELDLEKYREPLLKIKRPVTPSLRAQEEALADQLQELEQVSELARSSKKFPRFDEAVSNLKSLQLVDDQGRAVRAALTDFVAKKRHKKIGFPFIDPDEIEVHVATMYTSPYVRKDEPFAQVAMHSRKILALDMEAQPFLRLTSSGGTPSLVVKGVVDYANEAKNDEYHDYSAEAAARFVASIVQHCPYVLELLNKKKDRSMWSETNH